MRVLTLRPLRLKKIVSGVLPALLSSIPVSVSFIVISKPMALMLRLEKATKEITALAKDVISLAHHTMKRINFTSDDYV